MTFNPKTCLLFLLLFLPVFIASDVTAENYSPTEELPELIQEATLLFQQKEYRNSQQVLRRFLSGPEISPQQQYRALFLGAVLSEELEEYAEAWTALDELSRSDYELADYCLYRAARLMTSNDQKESALKLYHRFLQEFPGSDLRESVLYEASALWLEMGNPEKGFELINLVPRTSPVDFLKAELLLALDNYEDSRTLLKDILITDPLSNEAKKAAGRLKELSKGDTNQSGFQLSTQEQIEHLEILLKAKAYRKVYHESLVLLRKKLPPKDLEKINFIHGESCFHRYRLTYAHKRFTTLAQSTDPEIQAGAIAYLARISIERKRFTEAQKYVEQLMKLAPESPGLVDVCAALAQGYLLENKRESAYRILRLTQRLVEHGAEKREKLWLLGWTAYLTEHYEEAITFFQTYEEQALFYYDKHKALYWTAKSLMKTSQRNKGIEELQKLRFMKPSDYYCVQAALVLQHIGAIDKSAALVPDITDDYPIHFLFPLEELARLAECEGWNRAFELELLGCEELVHQELLRARDRCGDMMILQLRLGHAYHQNEEFNRSIPLFRSAYYGLCHEQTAIQPQGLLQKIYPLKYVDRLQAEAKKYQLPPSLIAAVILQESSFNEHAKSHAGAIGLMQIMPKVGKWLAQRLKFRPFSYRSLHRPDVNIKFGAYQLHWLLSLFDGDIPAVLASYNAGRTRVLRWQEKYAASEGDEFIELIPYSETRHFVKQVIRNYGNYSSLYPDLKPLP